MKFFTWPRSSVAAAAPGRGSTCQLSSQRGFTTRQPQAWLGLGILQIQWKFPLRKESLKLGSLKYKYKLTVCLARADFTTQMKGKGTWCCTNAEQSCLPRGARVHCLRAQEDARRPGLSITWASRRVQLMGYIKQM